MKLRLLTNSLQFLPLLLSLLIFNGCASTPLGVTAQQSGGDLYAQYELGGVTTAAQAASTVAALQLLAKDLPLIPAGQLSQHDAGALSATLQVSKAGIPANTNTQKVLDDLNSIINLVASGLSGGNGGMTATQGLAVANFTNVAVGIKDAIQYQEGKWSVSNPTWVPPATP